MNPGRVRQPLQLRRRRQAGQYCEPLRRLRRQTAAADWPVHCRKPSCTPFAAARVRIAAAIRGARHRDRRPRDHGARRPRESIHRLPQAMGLAKEPTARTKAEHVHAGLNLFRALIIYLEPVLPAWRRGRGFLPGDRPGPGTARRSRCWARAPAYQPLATRLEPKVVATWSSRSGGNGGGRHHPPRRPRRRRAGAMPAAATAAVAPKAT